MSSRAESSGVRLDRASIPGAIERQIHDGIARCDYIVAVLDGLRPNVLYELGIAHGRDKPSVLLSRVGALGAFAELPFDLVMQQRLEYASLDKTLVDRLRRSLEEQLPGGKRRSKDA